MISADVGSIVWIPSMFTIHWSSSLVKEWTLISTGIYGGSSLSDSLNLFINLELQYDIIKSDAKHKRQLSVQQIHPSINQLITGGDSSGVAFQPLIVLSSRTIDNILISNKTKSVIGIYFPKFIRLETKKIFKTKGA